MIGCSEPPTDCDFTLAAGSSETLVQTTLIEAPDDSIVCLQEGAFAFRGELSIAHDGLTLRGAGKEATILDFGEQDLGGNGIQISSDRVTIEHLMVRDTPGDGIRATAVTDVKFQNVAVLWTEPGSVTNGAYGFYPVSSDGVVVRDSVVSGSRDAGIYVGQSTHVLVVNNEAYGNVAGIEIENSTDVEVRDNYSHDNTAGILIFNLPDLPVQDGRRSKVHHNRIENNNLANFAEEGTVVSRVPLGVGMLVLASDDNEIHDNEITGNDSLGLLFLSYVEDLFGKTTDEEYDVFPQGNYTHHNLFENNGTAPAPLVLGVVGDEPVPDITWDGCVDPELEMKNTPLNCLSDNGHATYMNFDFCADSSKTSDISTVTCSYDALGEQRP